MTRSQTLSKRLMISVSVIALLMATASAASAQDPPDLFRKVETLTLSDGTPVAGRVSLVGDTIVVSGDGVVQVFDREAGGDQWVHSATLVPSGGGAEAVATDGNTIVARAAGAAYVFQRVPGGPAWQEMARLTGDQNSLTFGSPIAVSGTTVVVGALLSQTIPTQESGIIYVFERDLGGPNAWGEAARLTGDVNAVAFGAPLIISGTTVVVGAPSDFSFGPPGPLPTGPGIVYVFERDLGGPNAWGESARLMGEPPARAPALDFFGRSVAFEQDTVLVGALRPFSIGGPNIVVGHVFSRHHGGENAWGRVATLPGGGGEIASALVSISGDTALVGDRDAITPSAGFATIFDRDRGGPNAWGAVTTLVLSEPPVLSMPLNSASISGDVAVLGGRFGVGAAFARHQGGADVWGEVARFGTANVALSGDTILLLENPIDVYVADTDRDGLGDGIDACPRDPLNNVEGGCTRTSAAYLVLDDLITLGEVATEARGDEFHITATFTNTSDTAIGNPFFELTELTGGNVLMNGDAGPGGPGATLSPDVRDGILSPVEPTTVTFVIGLAAHEAFSFRVNVKGDAAP